MRRSRRQAGFTLIELMVALVVSSLLIGMILSIFTRMSMAYRSQQNVAELQQTLAAAQELIQRDVRQAGFQVPDGFRVASAPNTNQQALQITNNESFGPDLLRVFHADASAQARVVNLDLGTSTIIVDDRDLFAAGNLAVVVLTERDPAEYLPSTAWWLHYYACVVRIANVAGNALAIDTAAPWGAAATPQCALLKTKLSVGKPAMVFRFSARAYRIDPARRTLAVLQESQSGGLIANDWQDLGVGFTDLQIATRWSDHFDPVAKGVDTADADTDKESEWYSGEAQEGLTDAITSDLSGPLYHRPVPAEIRVSLVVRTIKKIDAVPTSATPALIDPARVDNNDLGDRPAVVLAGVADAARPAELRGDAVFRHATIGADLRNMAVGQ